MHGFSGNSKDISFRQVIVPPVKEDDYAAFADKQKSVAGTVVRGHGIAVAATDLQHFKIIACKYRFYAYVGLIAHFSKGFAIGWLKSWPEKGK
jgi:hypothetical protein